MQLGTSQMAHYVYTELIPEVRVCDCPSRSIILHANTNTHPAHCHTTAQDGAAALRVLPGNLQPGQWECLDSKPPHVVCQHCLTTSKHWAQVDEVRSHHIRDEIQQVLQPGVLSPHNTATLALLPGLIGPCVHTKLIYTQGTQQRLTSCRPLM